MKGINGMNNIEIFGIPYFKSGIKIKEKNKGSFTRYCKGKVTLECIDKGKNSPNKAIRKKAIFALNSRSWKHLKGGLLYSVGNLVNAIYKSTKNEEFLGTPWHKYDFALSEEWANAHGYFPDKRGHRDDRVKKESHPSHSSRGSWKGMNQFHLTDKGMKNINHTLFGLVDNNQDPQATLYYKGNIVLPEITITPKYNYIHNTYDNFKLK